MKTRTAIIGGVATVATLSAVGIGVASASPSGTPAGTPSSSSTSSPQAGHAKQDGKHHGKRALSRRALHGEATLGGAKKQRVVDFQRGTVSSIGSGTVTVKSVDGFTATYQTDAKTKVRKDKEKSALADVKVNDRVRVVGLKSGGTVTLRMIGDHGPKK